MCISAIFVIFCVFCIHSSHSGLITEKLKLSQDYAACPPGVWTCSTGKRSEIVKEEKTSRTVQRRAIKSYPPGIWAFHEDEGTGHENDNDKPENCPPGMWVCKKKRMLKNMLKTLLMKSGQDGRSPFQASNDACPPGVWTCSTGKRSEFIHKDQVKSPVLVNHCGETQRKKTFLRSMPGRRRKVPQISVPPEYGCVMRPTGTKGTLSFTRLS